MKRLILLAGLLLLMMQPALADSLTLPEGLTEIEAYAFYNCTELTGPLKIPGTVTTIGAHAFDGCTGLTGTVVLPENITHVDDTAFANTSLTVMTHDEYLAWLFPHTIENGEVTITGYQETAAHNLVIPDQLEGYPVTAIGISAFHWNGVKLTGTLTLPKTLKRIEEAAFLLCDGLTGDLVIPDSVTEIGVNAFFGCTGLDGTLYMSKNIRVLGDSAFTDTKLQGTIVVPTTVESWGRWAFNSPFIEIVWTHHILQHSIVDGEVTITGFQGVADASTVIPATIEGFPVTAIGNAAFVMAEGLTGELVLPDTIRTIGEQAFLQCTGLTGSLILPEKLETLGQEVFFGCSNLDGRIVLNEGLVSIGDHAFYECSKLTGELNLPSTLRSIGRGAFRRCGSLSGDLTIPAGVTFLSDEAFSETGGFTGTLTLPEGLIHIGKNAFYGCGFQGELKLPSTLKHIGKWAFGWNGFSGSLVFPASIKHIGDYAFEATWLSGEVVVPASVTYLGYFPFNTWAGMTVIYECEIKPGFDIMLNTIGEMEIIGYNNQPVENIKLPTEHDGIPVVGVGFCAFFSCDQLTGSLVIPEGYAYLDVQAFGDCTGLTGVPQLPSTLLTLYDRAFENCTGMSGTLVLADHVNLLGAPFDGSNLTVIQNGVVIYQPAATE